MSLSLNEVFDKVNAQADPTMGYVFDAPIHYVVLNNKENTWDMKTIAQLEQIYEEIEKAEGPGVVVTIGTGKKYFGTGFNLPWWTAPDGEGELNQIASIPRAQSLLKKVMTLNMPSMAVINGHAYAGGLILSLMHD